MQQCSHCGKPLTGQANFCPSCGHNLQQQSTSLVCPTCQTSYPPGTTFCTADGSRLVRPLDLIPRCEICHKAYTEDVSFCPIDGGKIKVLVSTPPANATDQQGVVPDSIFDQYLMKYPKASLENRFLASLLDGLIGLGLTIPAITVFIIGVNRSRYYYGGGAAGLIFFAILLYLIPITYSMIKDGLGTGQSWGKQALRLMVIDLDNNRPCSKGKSLVRNLISTLLAFIPFVGWLIEPIMVLSTDDGRKLGDKAANTMVIDRYYYE